MPKTPNAAAVKLEVSAQSSPERVLLLQRFFRTGPGDYAEGDRFLGLAMPQQRSIARQFRDLPLIEIQKLLDSPFHEHRMIALIMLVDQHDRADTKLKNKLHRFYVKNLESVNNWDLVDASAGALLGGTSRRQCGVAETTYSVEESMAAARCNHQYLCRASRRANCSDVSSVGRSAWRSP
jgi:hypothetical protein